MYEPCISPVSALCLSCISPVSAMYQPCVSLVSALCQPCVSLVPALCQPCVCPVSALCQSCVSPASALYQPCVSLVSALCLPCISPVSVLYQPCVSLVSALCQPCTSPVSALCQHMRPIKDGGWLLSPPVRSSSCFAPSESSYRGASPPSPRLTTCPFPSARVPAPPRPFPLSPCAGPVPTAPQFVTLSGSAPVSRFEHASFDAPRLEISRACEQSASYEPAQLASAGCHGDTLTRSWRAALRQ